MAKKANARRYAQAIFEIALEKNELERWQSDLKQIVDVVGDASFLVALESPKLSFEAKAKLLTDRVKEINPLVMNLARLLIVRASIGIVGGIANEYQRLLDSHQGIEPAEVTTAVPLDEKGIQKLTKNLGDLIGKKVVLKTKVDPDIVGGFVTRVGGKLLDGSTNSRLNALRRELVGADRKR